MEVSSVYQRLQQYFPNELENINFGQVGMADLSTGKNMFERKFPLMSFNQVHAICRNQERNVMNRIVEIKEKDIFQEMSEVCSNKDLKNIQFLSTQEMNQKIQQYSSHMTILQEKQMENQTDQPESDIMNIESGMDVQLEGDEDSHRELRNIFEEYDHHLPWNELGIYDLH